MKKFLPAAFLIAFLSGCNSSSTNSTTAADPNSNPEPPTLGYSVVNVYPHDTAFFTEGLEFYNGQLFESSGSGNGEDQKPLYPSAFGVTSLKTGKVDKKVELNNNDYFG